MRTATDRLHIRHVAAALLALLLLLAFAGPARAQTFPKFTGPVVDAAGVLSPPQEAALTADLLALQQRTGHQLVVATVPGLQGYPIEDYGYRLGRAWGVGRKDADDGAILLVAPAERKVRVEVGYGLTPILTDAFSGLVIRQQILPRFKAGDLPGGIRAGADALIQQVDLPDAQARSKAAAATVTVREVKSSTEAEGVGAIVFVVLFFLVIGGFSWLMSKVRGGRRPRRSSGVGDALVMLWTAAEVVDAFTGNGGGSSGGGGGWGGGGGGFGGGGGGSFGGGGASGSW